MKVLGWAVLATIILFFGTIFIVSPIMSHLGYSSVEASYHLQTHALLVTLVFTVIFCTIAGSQYVVEEVKKIMKHNNEE
ncbi:hypothetical protein [Salibacterium aidingense]|uniref:hypothetical protein n=1 Tax=Salibacterium aidingense TaxID=384933 RepID=UPI003BC9A941